MMIQESVLADFSREMRDTYLGAVPHTLFTGLVWLISAYWGDAFSQSQAIVIFIVGGTVTFPGGELIRKIMSAPNTLSKDNTLPQLFMLLAFTIPLCYPLIYLVCRNQVSLFFPSFTILVGAHYLPFVFGYKMKSFALLSMILVGLGTFVSIQYSNSFSLAGYLTGIVLLLFAVLHFLLIKNKLK